MSAPADRKRSVLMTSEQRRVFAGRNIIHKEAWNATGAVCFTKTPEFTFIIYTMPALHAGPLCVYAVVFIPN